MKKYVFAILAVSCLLISCAQPGNNTTPNENTNTYIGSWENFFGDTWTFTDTTYQQTLYLMGEVTYQEKGLLTVTGSSLSLRQEYSRTNETGTWVSSDFNSKFERDRVSYNSFLAEYGFSPLDETGYWDVHYQWAQDKANGGTTGSPYTGYSVGMSLDEYKNSAVTAYTATLTKKITWKVTDTELEVTIDNETEYFNKKN